MYAKTPITILSLEIKDEEFGITKGSRLLFSRQEVEDVVRSQKRSKKRFYVKCDTDMAMLQEPYVIMCPEGYFLAQNMHYTYDSSETTKNITTSWDKEKINDYSDNIGNYSISDYVVARSGFVLELKKPEIKHKARRLRYGNADDLASGKTIDAVLLPLSK